MRQALLIERETNQRIPLSSKSTVGRADDNFVVLAGRHVSRHHCEICKGFFGAWYVRQLGPKPGTQIGVGQTVTHLYREGRLFHLTPGLKAKLRSGDELAFGNPKGATGIEFTHVFFVART